MPAVFFPNLDALRLAVASGLVPPSVARAPARIATDANGRLWLETDESLPRDSLAALARLGVQLLAPPSARMNPVRSWAGVLPVRKSEAPQGGLTLFDLPERELAAFVARLRRLHKAPAGVRLLPEPHAGRAWVVAHSPPSALPMLTDPHADVRAYWQQADGVWVARGWEHPLPGYLVAPNGGVLLCDPQRGAVGFPGPVPEPRHEEFMLPRVPGAALHSAEPVRIAIRFRLKPDAAGEESFWVLPRADEESFREFCRGADERLLHKFEVASVVAGVESLTLVRRASAGDHAAHLPVATRGFRPDERLPWLFVPAGFALRPQTRVNELARELGQGEGRIVWLEAARDGVAVHSVAEAAFRPLWGQVEYAARPRAALLAESGSRELFPFARFALQVETTIDLEPEPEPDPPRPQPEEPRPHTRQPGWMTKSLSRVVQWVRRPRPQPAGQVEPPSAGREPDAGEVQRPDEPGETRVGRKLASADALLHGDDWAARRRELEARLVGDYPRLGPEERATRWAELAGVNAATGQAREAAVCWVNALWDCPEPPEPWLEQWALAECRAAKRPGRADLERWLGEPGRPGTGRVVAALAALHGFRASPSPEFVAALPRVLAILEQQFDDIPVRAAWLARLAVARSCDGDTLGVARWRDRLVGRLRDRGPGLDLDEPSFLRFRGRATAKRFKDACDWLDDHHERIRAWVAQPAGIGGLQALGLASETRATAEYARLMLAWGMGALGERVASRDWAARARKALARAGGPRTDPAGHALLGDLFLHRIKDAHEGHPPKPGLPAELQTRYEKLPEFARYSVDRLREHSRILQPLGPARAFRGLDVKAFWGTGRLAERLALLCGRSDPADVNDEARDLLAMASDEPTTSTVPRITFALLEVAPLLDPIYLDALLGLVPTALDWVEAWVQGGRWTDAERPARVARFQARMLESAFAVAPAAVAERLLRDLARGVGGGRMLPSLANAAPQLFRAARRFELTAQAEALIQGLDPLRGEWNGREPTPEQVGLAVGWYVAGDDNAGLRVIDAARVAVYSAGPAELSRRTALALAYAEALGFAPASIALGRLEEIFQRLPQVTVQCSSNCYFTLQPLRLVDAVVRSVVTDDFALSPSVRAWLDEDEFLIRRRIHRDMASLLRDSG